MAYILIVDDEKSARVTLKAFLEEDFHAVYTAENAAEALRLMDEYDFDVILSDIVLPHTNGMKLLKEIRERSSDIQIIMITGEPTVETATEAMRSGVFDYLAKPVARESVKKIVAKAAQIKALKDENRGYREHLEDILAERTKALLESEEKYRSLIENINVGIFRSSTGLKGKFIEANPATIKMFGCKNKEELLSIKFADICENQLAISNLNNKALRDRFIRSEEIQLKRRDGTPFTGSLSGVIVADESGEVKYFDGIIEDVTERKQIEEDRIERQKLQAILEIAGTTCHELNQPFQVISGYVEHILMHLSDDDPLWNPVRTIMEQVNIMAKITGKLNSITRYETRDYVGGIKIIDINQSEKKEQSKKNEEKQIS
ncbi:MAG TPA: hypothetical protein DHW42_00995 [Candidatus Marinimicrobia bacterium]|nr:hypothetical protein [Candidatus Neomarinimicrobiota bacterium]